MHASNRRQLHGNSNRGPVKNAKGRVLFWFKKRTYLKLGFSGYVHPDLWMITFAA